jgi:hypothetical protein
MMQAASSARLKPQPGTWKDFVGFEVFTAVIMKNAVFRDVAP